MTQSADELRAVHFAVPAENAGRVLDFLKEEPTKQLVEKWYASKVTMVSVGEGEKPGVAYDFVVRGEQGSKKFARAFYQRLSQFGDVFGGFIVQYSNGLE